MTIQRSTPLYVAGAGTFIGSAIVRRLDELGYSRVVGRGADGPDYRDAVAVERFFERERPESVIVAAGRTAGIAANEREPAELMADNLLAASHLIPAAHKYGVTRLLYLASSCMYPKHAPQPLQPSSLWSGPLEPTSDAYAASKLAGAKLCEAYQRQFGVRFFAGICGDAYGPGDDFSEERSHVVAALIRRMHDARERRLPSIVVWGTGTPRREFIYVDDLADACVFALERYTGAGALNLAAGQDTSIADLATLVREVVGYEGEIVFDRSKPDGMPFKGLDASALRALGWEPRHTLRAGLQRTYDWYR